MAEIVYLLCAFTSIACMVFLFRGYARTKLPLLFWSSAAFLAFAVANIFLFADLVIFRQFNLLFWRQLATLVGVVLLLLGLNRTKD